MSRSRRTESEDQLIDVYAQAVPAEDEPQDVVEEPAEEPAEEPVESPPQDVAAEESADDDNDPKKLIAKANDLFRQASNRVSSQQEDAMEAEARALVAKALELDPHALDAPEPEHDELKRERLTVPVK